MIQSYKYLSIRMRNDMCVDSLLLRMFEKQTTDSHPQAEEEEERGNAKPFELIMPALPSSNSDAAAERSSSSSAGSSGGGSSIASPPKESLLVQISNRVKLLERNATAAGSFLRQLNASLLTQAQDLDHILEAVIRAKETFKDSVREQVSVRGRLKALTERMAQVEGLVEESSQTVKLLMAAILGMAVSGLYLISALLGRSLSASSSSAAAAVATKEAATMTEGAALVNNTSGSNNSCLKKVAFQASPKGPEAVWGKSYPFCRRPPSRRVTWCGGGSVGAAAAAVDVAVAVRALQQHDEELELEAEILKSILKKATPPTSSFLKVDAGVAVAAAAAVDDSMSRRRVTWCGGYLNRQSDQLLRSKTREI